MQIFQFLLEKYLVSWWINYYVDMEKVELLIK